MALNKMQIPKTIHVGMQNRNDTYTGKLAYVIYTDGKGVKRKETSWQSWRDKKIDPIDYDNEPMSGFVLNKKVGGNNYSWNPRNTYVRVYDPRGFEFEISIPNLLFILQECSAIKGKGLEGDFVYAWDGTELVLLPVTCQEYKDSAGFTALQVKKVGKTDIKEGRIYVNKDNDRVIYLGRHDWSDSDYDYGSQQTVYKIKTKARHVFDYLDKVGYWIQDGFTKLGTMESDECSPLFADRYDRLKAKCKHYGKDFTCLKETFTPLDEINRKGGNCYYFDSEGDLKNLTQSYHDETKYTLRCEMGRKIQLLNGNIIKEQTYRNHGYGYQQPPVKEMTREQAAELRGERYVMKNANGCILLTVAY